MTSLDFPDAKTWAMDNFAAVGLNDARRTRRLVAAAEHLAERPVGTLPAAFDWDGLRALYRLADRPEATHQAVTAAHFAATRQAMAECPAVLILHDTTELDFTRHKALTGTGPIGDGRGRGFLQHNSLALDPADGRPLGLAFQQLAVRTARPRGETRTQRMRRPRESRLWRQGIEGVGPAPAGAVWVDVADRGADTFEAMHAALAAGHQFLFRACQDRRVRLGPGPEARGARLLARARRLPGRIDGVVAIAGKGGRPGRTAAVRLAAGSVWIQVPTLLKRHRPELEPIQVWVVRIWEPRPPVGEEPLEWVLLSSLAAESDADLRRLRDWYALRPTVEVFHQVEKSGCGVERLRLRTAERLAPVLGLLAVVAVRVLQLRWWGRNRPEASVAVVGTAAEVAVVAATSGVPAGQLTAGRFVREVAKLGGFLGRRGDGDPGWQTLWRGYQRLRDMVLGQDLSHPPVPTPGLILTFRTSV